MRAGLVIMVSGAVKAVISTFSVGMSTTNEPLSLVVIVISPNSTCPLNGLKYSNLFPTSSPSDSATTVIDGISSDSLSNKALTDNVTCLFGLLITWAGSNQILSSDSESALGENLRSGGMETKYKTAGRIAANKNTGRSLRKKPIVLSLRLKLFLCFLSEGAIK